MFFTSFVIFWLMMALVAEAGWLAQWGKTAAKAISAQAETEGKSPMMVFAELYFFCLCVTSPLALMALLVSTGN